jgi:hypothetical protein
MKRSFSIFLACACIVICGCGPKSEKSSRQAVPQTKAAIMVAFATNALAHSPSFAELKARSKYATFVVDSDSPDFMVVGIGEDMGTHFTRFRTLRIDKKTGAIARLETDQNLEDKWQIEFQPRN